METYSFFDKNLVLMMQINWASFGGNLFGSSREIQFQSKTVSHFRAENWQGESS